MAFAQVTKRTVEEIAAMSVDEIAALSAWPRRMAAKEVGMLPSTKEETAYNGLDKMEQATKILEHAQKVAGAGPKKGTKKETAKREPAAATASKRTPRNGTKKETKPAPEPQQELPTGTPMVDAAALGELKAQLETANQNIEALVGMNEDLLRASGFLLRSVKALLAGTGLIAEAAYEGMTLEDYLSTSFTQADNMGDPAQAEGDESGKE